MNRKVQENKSKTVKEMSVTNDGTGAEQLSSINILSTTTSLHMASTIQREMPIAKAGLLASGTLRYSSSGTNRTVQSQTSILQNALENAQLLCLQKDCEIAQLKKQLQEANGELTKFVYAASHDLKEPVRMISNFMGLLKSKYAHQLDEKANTYLDFAIDGGVRMYHMIDDLLVLSRVGRCADHEGAIDFNDIVASVTKQHCKQAKEVGAMFEVNSNPFFLTGNRSELTGLFCHLVGNALKFSNPSVQNRITIKGQQKDGLVYLSIEDTGLGMTDEECEKAFDLFSRFQPRATHKGSGLGLALCKKIVDQHGGTISIQAQEGEGCKVEVVLPAGGK